MWKLMQFGLLCEATQLIWFKSTADKGSTTGMKTTTQDGHWFLITEFYSMEETNLQSLSSGPKFSFLPANPSLSMFTPQAIWHTETNKSRRET
jgi:hypothetical protein